MLKILLKAAVLFLIVISVYFIVNPSACSNMLAGRETVPPVSGHDVQWRHPMAEEQQFLPDASSVPAGVMTEYEDPALYGTDNRLDTNTTQKPTAYSQEDIDAAVANRYVELEQEYSLHHPLGKDASREISFIVMDEFEMSPAEWESFLSRATANNLFDRIRRERSLETPENSAQ